MTDDVVLAYVKATAAMLALPLDEARAQRVAGHLSRTAVLAKLLDDTPLGVEVELAEIYKPAPFVSHANGISGS
jgi:Protein of unknown function (DUF4089)